MPIKKNLKRRLPSPDDFSEEEESSCTQSERMTSNVNLSEIEKKALQRLNITVDLILTSSTKDLNSRMRNKNSQDAKVVRALRRKLKNRGYAANCRDKLDAQIELLKKKKAELTKYIKDKESSCEKAKKMIGEFSWKNKLMEDLLDCGRRLIVLDDGKIAPETPESDSERGSWFENDHKTPSNLKANVQMFSKKDIRLFCKT